MNQKRIHQLLKFVNYLLTGGLIFILTACQSPFRRTYYSNYFQPGFECSSEPVGRNEDKFKRYLIGWELVKNDYNNQNKSKGKADVVLIGDSLVHLFPPSFIASEFFGIDIVLRGIGGDRTYTLLNRIEENALSLNPKTIILEIGGNDLIDEKCLDFLEGNVQKLIQKIKSYNSNTNIIFLAVPPTTRPELNSIVPTYNAFLQNLAYNDKKIKYLDAWTEMRSNKKPTIKDEYIRPGDDIHFNENAYKVWGKLIRKALKE
ncbi:MAG: lipase [Leptospiraceae bacterium]|nr:lipase [Leptospiraceae bacterium]